MVFCCTGMEFDLCEPNRGLLGVGLPGSGGKGFFTTVSSVSMVSGRFAYIRGGSGGGEVVAEAGDAERMEDGEVIFEFPSMGENMEEDIPDEFPPGVENIPLPDDPV